MKGLTSLLSLCALFSVLPVACLYDADDRCGPRQVNISNDRCACADGYIQTETDCVPCGENEQARNNACLCVEGFARTNPNEPCEKPPEELGTDCDADSSVCPDPSFPVCHVDGEEGYCTAPCETSDDCTGGYKCQEGPEPYCRRPPIGLSDTCDTDEDCAGKEASICEKIQSHQCLVPCGPGDTSGCFVDDACCAFPGDFVACVPAFACVPENFGMVVE